MHGNPKIYWKNTKDLVQYWKQNTERLSPLHSWSQYCWLVRRIQGESLTMTIRNKIQIDTSLLFTPEVSNNTDLYTESKEREIDNKYYEKIFRIYLNPWISQYLRWNLTKYCKKSEKREGFQSKYCEKYCD